MMRATTGRAPHAYVQAAAPLRTDTDVLRRVGHLVGAAARRRRSLWLLFTDAAGRQLPDMTIVDDVPRLRDEQAAAALCSLVARVLRAHPPGSRAVVVLTGPPGEGCDGDFARLLQAADSGGASVAMLCRATPQTVRALA